MVGLARLNDFQVSSDVRKGNEEPRRRVAAHLVAVALVALTAACGGGGGGSPPPPPPPPITVAVAPTTQNVLLGATQQFTATVSGSTNTAVTWSVNGITGGNTTVGTINASGLYTAPAILPSPAAVSIRATSVANGTSSASATVTVTSDVVVSITAPAQNASVEVGAPQQVSASIASTGNGASQNVNWSVSGNGCAGAACGTITGGGVFTAPGILPGTACSLPATGVNCVTVTATSVADPSKTATLTLRIAANFTFTITGPASGTIDNATSFQFTFTLTPVPNSNPSTMVTWSVSDTPGGCAGTGCGTIDQAGLYSAPNVMIAPPAPQTVTINAVPVADPSPSHSRSVTVTINTVVIVTVSPTAPSVEIEAQQQFIANVGGLGGTQNVTWDVNGIVNGNAAVGFITNPGPSSTPAIYTAPPSIPSIPIVVTATSVSDPTKSASATLSFFSTISAILQPSGSTRAVNHAQTFSGALTRTSTGTTPVNSAVTWSVIVNGVPVPGGDATNGFICLVGVTCSGGNKVSSSGVGNPTGDVDYVAPASAAVGTATIEMRSQADPSKFARAMVTIIQNVQVTVSPSTSTLPTSGSQQFSANVVGAFNQSVTWSVAAAAGGACNEATLVPSGAGMISCGTINASGNYTAPNAAPAASSPGNQVSITATSVDSPGQSGSGTVTISTGAFISKISPASITALGVGSTDFLLKVQGLNFFAGAPGSGSTIVLGTVPPTSLSATCSTIVCTATVLASSVNSAGDYGVQVVNPPASQFPGASNQVALKVLDPATQQKDFDRAAVIPVSAGPQPVCQAINDAGCQNITVVEPTTAGTTLGAAGQVNITGIGFFTPGLCSGGGTAITITRPISGAPPKNVDICLFGSNALLSTYIYTISGPSPAGPTDIAISGVTAFGSAVKFTLTIPSTAQAGPRTFFVETPNREKSALVGAIEVK